MDVTRYNQTVQGWIGQVHEHRGRSASETLKYAVKILDYGGKTLDTALIGYAHYYMGETFYMLNDVEAFYKSAMQGLEYLQDSGQWELMARACNLLGIVSGNQGNAPFALDYYLSGAKICEKYGLPKIKAMIEYNIGTIYMCYGEYTRAIRCLKDSSKAFLMLPKEEAADTYMGIVNISLASCCLGCGRTKEAGTYLLQARKECTREDTAQMYLLCAEARYYNQLADEEKRDACIALLSEKMTTELTVMEAFDDFYIYCRMLLDIQRYKELWKMLDTLERVAKKSKLIYLQRKLLTLKIEYYKKKGDQEGYLNASGLYYELSKALEKEEKFVIGSMMNVRFSLEAARRKQREMEAENEALHRETERDVLTGISNRLWLNRYAREAFAEARAGCAYFAVELLDVDYFKEYNDNYGHQLGDECLKAIAQEMAEFTKQGSIFCARYGGDEFILLYEGYTPDAVEKLAVELKERILALRIVHSFSDVEPYVTVSQGICCDIPGKNDQVSDYLYSADVMLYRVKEKGRGGVAVGTCQSEISGMDKGTGTE